jgi:hypothetical protein
VSALGTPLTVWSFELMCVSANAMFSVPRVTMNGGSRSRVTSPPLRTPNPVATSRPMAIASSGGTPPSTASFVMKIDDSAMTAPHDRSMPAVRMISVWPMASVPTTITCWSTSERFEPDRKRSDLMEKKTTAIASASNGPATDTARARTRNPGRRSCARDSCPSVTTSIIGPGCEGNHGRSRQSSASLRRMRSSVQ